MTYGFSPDGGTVRSGYIGDGSRHGHNTDEDHSNDHLASVYEDREAQLARVVPFIHEGLKQGERCLYVADDNARAEVVAALRDGGVDVDEARSSGALSILTKEETYLRTGEFDRDAMLEFGVDALDRAQTRDGFEGIRAAAEMTWALDSGTDLDDLTDYEALLNTIYPGEDYTVLCQYNQNRFPAEVIADVVRTHPLLVHDNTVHHNPHYALPSDYLDSERSRQVNGSTKARGDDGGKTAAPTTASTISSTASQPVRILYVDDEPGYAAVAAEFLEKDDRIDTVVPETDPCDALCSLDEERFDCVISDYDMPGNDGLALFEMVRQEHPDLPFILVTGKGGETIASKAISAGVTDYFRKRDGIDQYTTLAHRVTNAVEQYRAEQEIKQTRRQHRRLIEESADVITIVDEEGRFQYTSPATERQLGYSADELLGECVFDYIHPDDEAAARERFATLIEQSEAQGSTEFRFQQPDGSWLWLEGRGRNLLDDPDIQGLIVYARDITEHKERERTLRESEQRFRSLFEKAFDAMVIADDDGKYVDANPAACELFELSREELVGRSIAEFAPDDYDVETAWQQFQASDAKQGTFPLVSAEGTERVVEFAATPNIVPGQHLSVIRDVTEREQYERTLAALHDTSRELLGAESRSDVAESIVGTATDVLSMSAVVVYLFDPANGLLKPGAFSDGTIDEETLVPLSPDRNSAIGATFLHKEPRVLDHVDEDGIESTLDQPLQSALLLPLADYGVCVIGDTESNVTDNDREFAEILAAAAETALDRVEQERALRERKTELQGRNRKLKRLHRLNATVHEINSTIVQADTRDEIEEAVCESLSTLDDIGFVWVGRYGSQRRRLVPRAWADDDEVNQYLDTISLSLDEGTEPTTRALGGETPVYEANIADDPHGDSWRTAALANGFRSVFSVPLTYKQIPYGTITVYAEQADFFGDRLRMVLIGLSNAISNAINAIEHQNAVLSETTTEVEVRFTDERVPLHRIASHAGCSLDVETITPQSGGNILKRVNVDGVDPETVAEIAEKLTAIAEASVVTDTKKESIVELRFSGKPLTDFLADRGIRVPKLTVDAESVTATLLVPETIDLSWVFEKLRTRYSEPELVAKREQNRSDTATSGRTRERYRSKLTPRQREVLRTAYLSGFFMSPRECTGEELAERLGVSSQTVYRHIRTAERKLFETVFDEGGE